MENVVIKKCPGYDLEKVKAAVKDGFELLGGLDKFINREDKVLLKVNCLFPSEPEKAVITHPVVVRAVIRVLKDKTSNIWIGDSPGFGSFLGGAKKCGYEQVAKEENVGIIEFKEEEDIKYEGALNYKTFKVDGIVNKADKIINMPKFKTHGLMYMTLAVKNMFGIIPGTGKAGYHFRAGRDKMLFAKMLVDLYRAKPPAMNIVDGIIGMEGNGPGGGNPVNAGVIVMGRDGFAVDHVMPQIAGLDPDKVWTNLVYKKFVNEGRPPEVNILGESIENVRGKKFTPVAEDSGRASFGPKFLRNFIKDLLSPKQVYIKERCTACLKCVKSCPVDALVYNKEKKRIDCDYDKCIACFICQEICPEKAIVIKKPLFGAR
jgi:uncharacterized protein (DUF362 family)/Pyruvate/2-oxoacid:ferredoxin oxidoreductase delta subunit